MGLWITRENIEEASIFAITLQNPMTGILDNGRTYRFTESYFYHEFLFFWLSAVELEAGHKFISKIKRICEVDLGLQPFNSQAILTEMHNYAYLIPITRMKEIGISPAQTQEQFEDWHFERLEALKELQRKAVRLGIRAAPDPEPMQVGLAPRNTDYHNYLGALSDGMVEAVGGSDDPMFATALEMAVLIKRRFMFGEMQKILAEGLVMHGIGDETP